MNQAQSLTLRSSTDILDVVPTLLGFIPTESLVIIYLDTTNGHTRIVMTARMNLPIGPAEVANALKIISQHARVHDAMILLAYSVDSDLADVILVTVLNTVTMIEIKVAISASTKGWAEVEIDEPIHCHAYTDETSVLTTAILGAGLPHPQQTRDDLEQTIAGPVDLRRAGSLRCSSQASALMVIKSLHGWPDGCRLHPGRHLRSQRL